MDVRRLGLLRQTSPRKRPGLCRVAALLAAAVAAVVAVGATTAGASTQTMTWVADPSTADGFSAILGNEEPLNSRFAGRVWTDKSVTTDAAQGARGGLPRHLLRLGVVEGCQQGGREPPGRGLHRGPVRVHGQRAHGGRHRGPRQHGQAAHGGQPL